MNARHHICSTVASISHSYIVSVSVCVCVCLQSCFCQIQVALICFLCLSSAALLVNAHNFHFTTSFAFQLYKRITCWGDQQKFQMQFQCAIFRFARLDKFTAECLFVVS